MFAVTTTLPEHNKPITEAKLETKLKIPKSQAELDEIAAKKKAAEEAIKAAEGDKKKKNKKNKKKRGRKELGTQRG